MKRICFIGVGNTLRSDDGAGAVVSNYFEKNYNSNIEVVIVPQLDITLIEDLSHFKYVVFIDAALNTTAVFFEKIGNELFGQSYSHHVNAVFLSHLSSLLFSHETTFYLCGIGIEDISFGEKFSTTAQENIKLAISQLENWLKTI